MAMTEGRLRKKSDLSNTKSDTKQKKNQKDVVEKFDIKTEKKKANKFWREAEQNMSSQGQTKPSKKSKGAAALLSPLVKRESAKESKRMKKASRNQTEKDKSSGAQSKNKKGQKQRIQYEEFLKVDDEIKKELDSGRYFEGVLKINPNNRNRAFVSVDGIAIDVMIDGLGCQNRALDGDTVVI